jgi:hypothetical protein
MAAVHPLSSRTDDFAARVHGMAFGTILAQMTVPMKNALVSATDPSPYKSVFDEAEREGFEPS